MYIMVKVRETDNRQFVVYHYAPDEKLPDIMSAGLKSGMPVRPKRFGGIEGARELTVRRIFDMERPSHIRQSQLGSVFFTLKPWARAPGEGEPVVFERTFITAKAGGNCLVANAAYMTEALKAVKGDEVAPDEDKRVRGLARKYWRESMPLQIFIGNYELKAALHWVKCKDAPPNLPGEVYGPEVLYKGDIPPEQLRKATYTFTFRKVSGGHFYDYALKERGM